MSILLAIGFAFAALAGAVHVYIFVLESLLWTRPKTWRTFGLRNQADADTTRPFAYNQGFYNLFLALGVFTGLALLGINLSAGMALILAATISMVLAAVVLVTSNRRMLRAAAIQGTLPLLGALLIVLSLAAIPAAPSAYGLPSSYERLTIIGTPSPAGGDVGATVTPGDAPITDEASETEFNEAPLVILDPERPGELAIVLFGSSSCPALPTFYDTDSEATLAIATTPSDGNACTDDLVPTVTSIEVPPGYAPVRKVTIDGADVTIRSPS